METKIYFNPDCSKCRQTLVLLKERNIEPTVVEYLRQQLAFAEMETILDFLGREPLDILRKSDDFHRLGLQDKNFSRREWIETILKHPYLLERPIVIHGNKAVIARPPEKVLEIL